MADYDSHYELPGSGTVSIDYGDQDSDTRSMAESVLMYAVKMVRSNAENTNE